MAKAARLADILRDRIVRGALAPDERIVERKLCAELAVSRTPLREALKLLEIDGLVEIHRNRGARVAPLGSADARHLFEVLAGIEATAASLAAERIGARAMETLEDMHARMLGHFRAGERDAYFTLNSEIHEVVLAAAANPHLSETHARLMLRAMRGRYAAIMEPQRLAEAMGEHDALMAALRVRDGVAAGRIWRRHLLRTGEAVAGVIDRAEDAADGVAIP
ncbi:MAG: GntR family transcriptional regulator [Pseudomonadota bacterium]